MTTPDESECRSCANLAYTDRDIEKLHEEARVAAARDHPTVSRTPQQRDAQEFTPLPMRELAGENTKPREELISSGGVMRLPIRGSGGPVTGDGGAAPLQEDLFGEAGSGIAAEPIAEQAMTGNGASVLDYVKDLDRAFAIPILDVTEYAGLSAGGLRAELGRFHPPQGYVRLSQHPELLAVCEKVAADSPVRWTDRVGQRPRGPVRIT